MGGETSYYAHIGGTNQPDWNRNGELLAEEGYTSDLLANEAIRFIRERDKDRPFFLDLSLNAPHTPLEAPGRTWPSTLTLPIPTGVLTLRWWTRWTRRSAGLSVR